MARSPAAADPFARVAAPHDHGRCLDAALDRAEQACKASGARLTPIRRRVLELIWGDHKPVGAYDLLGKLAEEGWGSAPPLVYRALSFLESHGLVHRLTSINAFVGCSLGGEAHAAQFLICRDCGVAVELRDERLARDLAAAADEAGFLLEAPVVEIAGRCRACAHADATGAAAR
ncbi:Fur family transcriptional regulator [Novispirillum sp. DQ9]|uniref:Fur family transcriptional regulator n=1 Tax=Novispirillum sp. DQ9 TaxID=3398612 RepID=UPI003C7B9B3B